MFEDPESIIRYYEQRAPEYEQIYYRDIPQKQKELAVLSEDLKQLSRDKTVLDLACGTGYWTVRISRTASYILASDISGEMIDEAKKKSYRCPVDFVRADLYHLPVAAGSFDLITLGFWFSHEPLQNYDVFCGMLKPLLSENGKIWMIDNNPPAEGPDLQSVGTDKYGNNYKQRFLNSGKEFAILKNYFSENQLRDIFGKYYQIERLTNDECYWSIVLSAH
ncbi:MAG: class I SAM-dependent methyltransferase [Candidatus Zixiibacteriota bacterium]